MNTNVISIPKYDTRKAGDLLDWREIITQLSTFAGSEPGKKRCEQLEFFNDKATIQRALQDVNEAKEILETGTSVGFSDLSDLTKSISRTQVKGVLNGKELLNIAWVLNLARQVRKTISDKEDIAPELAVLARSIFSDIGLEKEINGAIDKDGNVKNNASDELKALRYKYHSIHNQVHKVLNGLMDSRKFDDLLQDGFFTLRSGRYVLPVRVEKKSQVEGIVHDISSSGLSIYIEPKEVTNLNNTLRTCELEIEREIYRILAFLSFKVADNGNEILDAVKWLTELDFIFAKAKYSIRLDACAPKINTSGIVELKGLRHPVLIWQGEKVVANDLFLDDKKQVLLITGPNTGGKTVALKSVGICALMARAGLHIPVNPDSHMSLFKRIFALIGDEQSIQNSLSSFSAHLLGLRYILENLVPESLVLIDEIGEGTDPNQGIALSKAIIDHLITGRVRTIITTHFTELTSLGFLEQPVLNASMEFDKEKFEPTFKLVQNLPGKSSAFSIADKMGLDKKLIEKARQYASGNDSRIDEVMTGLQKQQEELGQIIQNKKAKEEEAIASAIKKAVLLEEIKARKEKFIKEEKERIKKDFVGAKTEIKKILKGLQSAPTYRRVEKARGKVKRIEKNISSAFPKKDDGSKSNSDLLPIMNWENIQVGDSVFVKSVNNVGALIKPPDKKGYVQVTVAGVRLSVSSSTCYFPKEDKTKKEKRYQSPIVSEDKSDYGKSRPSLSCDLRGKVAQDALAAVQEFLDDAYRRNFSKVTIIHGHGTGVLKKEVREYCKSSPYLKSWRPGNRGEGGDGATVVELDL